LIGHHRSRDREVRRDDFDVRRGRVRMNHSLPLRVRIGPGTVSVSRTLWMCNERRLCYTQDSDSLLVSVRYPTRCGDARDVAVLDDVVLPSRRSVPSSGVGLGTGFEKLVPADLGPDEVPRSSG
jgi:hypothetical protein